MWKRIKNDEIEPIYDITEDGLIRNNKTGKLIKGTIKTDGYVIVKLKVKGGKQKHFYIHRLVLETYSLFRKPGKNTVNHKDGNKQKNHVFNLEWMNTKEQNKHALDTGLRKPAKGEDCNSVYTEDIVIRICQCLEKGILKPKQISLEIEYPYDRKFKQLVIDIKARRNWTYISDNFTW